MLKKIVLFLIGVLAVAQPRPKSTQDGLFTDAQAARGLAAFTDNCSRCHGQNLLGIGNAPLAGDGFINKWAAKPMDGLFRYMRTRMPQGAAGSLPENTYVDIVSYVLKTNEMPSGAGELSADVISTSILTSKSTAKLPTNALGMSIGCLGVDANGTWTLNNATEPARTGTPDATTPEELQQSAALPLGNQTFRLANAEDFKEGFNPATFKGHKVQAKGALLRQKPPATDRITLISLDSVSPTCAP